MTAAKPHNVSALGEPTPTAAPVSRERYSPHLLPELARYAKLSRLQAYYEDKQYKGRPDFFTGLNAEKKVVPLRERAPCIITPLPRNCVRQTSRFMVGDGRWPALKIEAAEADDENGVAELTTKDAEDLKKGLEELVKKARLKPWFRRILERGMSEGTVPVTFALRRGRFRFELPHARDCWPTFRNNDPEDEVLRMVWCFRYCEEVEVDGRVEQQEFWFRRDYDETNVTSYARIPYITGQPPAWQIETAEPHGFGFCPVRWFRNMSDCASGIDGISLYDGLFNEFDALNMALSQRHRGIHYYGVPQPYETGVEDDDGPGQDGRKAAPGYQSADGMPEGKGMRFLGSVALEKARRMAPDNVWSYRGENVKVGLAETSGAPFEATTKHVDDVRGRTLEAMGVVLFTAGDMLAKGVGDMTAKLLGMLYAPLLALVDDYRDATWGPALLEILTTLVRILGARGAKGVSLRNGKRLAELAKLWQVDVEDGSTVWMPPDVELLWGEHFTPSNDEMQAGVTMSVAAKDGGLIQAKSATEFVAPYFGVKDVEAEIAAIEADADLTAEKELERGVALADGQAQAKAAAMPPPAPPGAKPPPPGAAATPKGPR